MSKFGLSWQTRKNWLMDVSVFLGGVIAAITGIYFLFLPTGGYRGGRNMFYGVYILADRHTWEDWHTWSGIVMIVAAVIHLIIHWQWVVMMTKRIVNVLRAKGSALSSGAKLNVFVDLMVAINFVLAAISGIYFFFFGGEGQAAQIILFDATIWDLIHTWSGTILVVAVLVHLWIHWRWIVNVTSRFFQFPRQSTTGSVAIAE